MSNIGSTFVQVSRHKKKEKGTGYLICTDCVLGSVGYLQYTAQELGISGRSPYDKVSVYRSADELFNEQSMATLENKAFVIGHPDNAVTAENDSQLRKGVIHNIRRDGDLLKGDIVVTDAEAIRLMRRVQCLSLGYRYDLVAHDDGTYSMENIVYNHIALVERGRSNVARVNDSATEINSLFIGGNKLMRLWRKKVIASDSAVETANDGCTALDEVKKALDCGTLSRDELKSLLNEHTANDADEEVKQDEKSVEEEKEEKTKNANDSADNQVIVDSINEGFGKLIAEMQKPKGNDVGSFQQVARDAQPKEKTFEEKEMERSAYYQNTLNPHKNPKYKQECGKLSDFIIY